MSNGHAQVDTLIVDPSACSGGPPVYCDLQAALDGAAGNPNPAGVYFLLTAGTYDAAPVGGFTLIPGNATTWTAVIKPYPGHEDQVIIDRNGDDLPFDPGEEQEAAIEIHNDADGPHNTCYDMRVTIEGLRIETTGYASGISVRSSVNDPTRLYNTGLFIRGNTITNDRTPYIKPGGSVAYKRGKGLVIGQRPKIGGVYHPPSLADQSIKWGEITDNEIHAGADGATCWAFSGLIANNRVRSVDNEGWHHSLGRIVNTQQHPAPPFLLTPEMDHYRKLLVEHNLFYCNWQLGFHFAHGSIGTIRNNIFARSWAGGEKRGGIGLVLGMAQQSTELACQQWGGAITEQQLSVELGLAIYTEAEYVVNNTVDANFGNAVLIENASVHVNVFKCNLLTRTNGDVLHEEKALDCHAAPPGVFGESSPEEPEPVGWNVYWGNPNGNYGDPIFVGTNDKQNANPHYVANLDSPEKYSHMLRTEFSGPPCAHVVQGQQSGAIDAGPLNDEDYYDAEGGPGLGLPRGDAGAFGGQFNWWDPTGGEECLQYDTGVVNCAK